MQAIAKSAEDVEAAQAAFTTLMHRHLDALYSYALRLSNSPATAEDLVQDTWLQVWRKARTFKPGKVMVTTWLHRILHNKFVDGLRRSKIQHGEAPLDSFPEAALGLTQDVAEASTLNLPLEQLQVNHRAVLLLKYAQGFSNPEIARITGSSVRAVESTLARAKRALKNLLAESAKQEEAE